MKTITAISYEKLVIFLSLLLIFVISDSDLNTILYLNINVKKISVFVPVVLAFLSIIVFKNRKIKLDCIFVLLILRIPFFLLHPLILGEFRKSYFANYLIVMLAPFIYQATIEIQSNTKELIQSIIKFSVIIIFLQLVATVLITATQSVPLYQYKSHLVIPVGASNYIAAILLLYTFISLITLKSKIYFLFCIIGIVLTLSNGAVLSLCGVLMFTFFILIKDKKINNTKIVKNTLIVISIIVTLVIIMNLFNIDSYILKSLTRFNRLLQIVGISNDNSLFGNVNIDNGRNSIFSDTINIIFEQNILIGGGLGVISDKTKIHNWFMQGLLNGGIIGTLLYYYPIFILIKRFWKNRKNDYSLGMLLAIMSSLLHGLIEPNYFTASFECIIWLLCGLVCNLLNTMKGNENNDSNMRNC